MPRGRRRSTSITDPEALQRELEQLKARQAELRRQLREMRTGGSQTRKLEEKLAKQLAGAKWTVREIKQLQPDWDDVGFYQTVQPKQPTPRGRRPRTEAA